ncbi:YcxB family protein [Desulfonispora thiosulfatigenes]|nr:YcxB family protein [Desulfonispora thiosulfatigenes]
MIIDENNLKVISADSTEVISLKSIKFVKVYDDMILIYLSAVTAQIIPTRYLNENSKRYLLKILSIN